MIDIRATVVAGDTAACLTRLQMVIGGRSAALANDRVRSRNGLAQTSRENGESSRKVLLVEKRRECRSCLPSSCGRHWDRSAGPRKTRRACCTLAIGTASGNERPHRTLVSLVDEMSRFVALGSGVQVRKPEIKDNHCAGEARVRPHRRLCPGTQRLLFNVHLAVLNQ
jgi:hypothetical protein